MNFVNIKSLSIAAFLLIGITVSAQKYDREYNVWSVEVQTGYHIPLAPNKFVELGDYDGAFKQVQAGVRYMINDTYGIRAHFGTLNFEDPNDSSFNIKYKRVALDGVANVWKVMDVKGDFKNTIGLLFHLGAGVTFANPSSISRGTDHIGNIIVGFTPQLKISKNFAFYGDVSYMANIKQHYSYGGELFDLEYKHETGGLVNLSAGLIFSFGNKENHADWYYK